MLTVAQAAYFAGILDGEGTFSVRKSKSSVYNLYASEVGVGTTTPSLIDWIITTIPGGTLHDYTPQGNRERVQTWRVSNKEGLIWLLPQLVDFLVIKKLHAQLLYKYCKEFSLQIAGVPLTAEELALKDAYCTLFTNLNTRGFGSLDNKDKIVSLFASGEISL